MLEFIDIAERRCCLFAQAAPQCLLVQPLGGHEDETLSQEVAEIAAAAPLPFVLAAFEIADWQRDLMPWTDPAVSKRPDVGDGATDALRYLLEGLLPWLQGRFGDLPVVLGGYSLAALFSLWAARETNAFAGVAAASPSVWIQGWPEYANTHQLLARQAYLSLGKREAHTRNRAIAQIADRIQDEHALLQCQLGDDKCALEWHPGGHFVDCKHRLARAFVWNLQRLGGLSG